MALKNIFYITLVVILTFQSCKTQVNNSEKLPVKTTLNDSTMIQSSNEFSFNLFSNVNKKLNILDNSFLSPIGVQNILALTSLGAEGETKEQIKKMLNVSGYSDQDLEGYFNFLMTHFSRNEAGIQLNFANSIWYKPQFIVSEAFLNSAENHFMADVQKFKSNSQESVSSINQWVDNQTNGAIGQIIDQIPDDLAMLLLNAIYFKGNWADEFDPDITENAPFTLANGETIQVPMMQKSARFEIANSANFDMLGIPYKDSTMTAWFIKGKQKGKGTSEFSLEDFQNLKKQSSSKRLFVKMPKYKFTFNTSLVDVLSELGGDLPFSNRANFENMINSSVKIGDVKHTSFVEVNEEGTEAAAVTSVEVVVTSMPMNPQEFILNEPFLFLIEDKNTEIILFLGNIQNPNSVETTLN